jgi:hypothetical protein
MPKVSWNDLLARDGDAHVIVAKLPDESDEETLRNGRAPQQLLERLFRKLPMRGEYALAVSRRTGQRAILCAFRDASDAAEAAKATDAHVAVNHQGQPAQYHLLLDGLAEQKISLMAGPPERRRTPRKTSHGLGRP